MRFKRRTVMQLADMICGYFPTRRPFFPYRVRTYVVDVPARAPRPTRPSDGPAPIAPSLTPRQPAEPDGFYS